VSRSYLCTLAGLGICPSAVACQAALGRLWVNVQLIDAETGNHLWAERFEKPVTDLFDMQDEIVS
jgi:TolB-like protein